MVERDGWQLVRQSGSQREFWHPWKFGAVTVAGNRSETVKLGTLAWYSGELGLEALRADEWRAGQVFFPSVRVSDDTIIDLLQVEPNGNNVDHLCLVVDPVDLDELAASGRFDVVDGPGPRFGAR